MVKTREVDQRSVDEVVADLIGKNGWEKQLDLYSIFRRWAELVPEEIAEHCWPGRIDRDVLWLEVENSAWMTELQYQRYELLEKVNSILTLGRIRDIKMALPKKDGGDVYGNRSSGTRVVFVPPSEEAVGAFDEMAAAHIHDKECRESLKYFWYLAQACKRDAGV